MAYLFLSHDDGETGGNVPEDDEAALLIQPGGRLPAFTSIGPAGTKGRSLTCGLVVSLPGSCPVPRREPQPRGREPSLVVPETNRLDLFSGT